MEVDGFAVGKDGKPSTVVGRSVFAVCPAVGCAVAVPSTGAFVTYCCEDGLDVGRSVAVVLLSGVGFFVVVSLPEDGALVGKVSISEPEKSVGLAVGASVGSE